MLKKLLRRFIDKWLNYINSAQEHWQPAPEKRKKPRKVRQKIVCAKCGEKIKDQQLKRFVRETHEPVWCEKCNYWPNQFAT